MDKETEEAIQEIGRMARNVNNAPSEIADSFLRISLMLLGVLVILFAAVYFDVPRRIQCDVLNDPFCDVPTAFAVVEVHEMGAVVCTFGSGEENFVGVFDYGWSEVESYVRLNPGVEILHCG